ncbi:Hypothetical protein HVR_LOCUS854 [uncultured virus]|nr:Hypothetical protein HVR_LOCUS854 [uncultured virus]
MDVTSETWHLYVPYESRHLITPEIQEIVTKAIRAAIATQRPMSNIFKSYEATENETESYEATENETESYDATENKTEYYGCENPIGECYGCGNPIGKRYECENPIGESGGYRLTPNSPLYCSRTCWKYYH